ncbi:MAG: biotin transporter BioY [Candidatus Omnitrophota bacterium]
MEIIFKKELIHDKSVCRLLAVGAFIVLTALSAFVRIPLPFTPVPLTLQTFFVLLSGALLGRKLGVVTQAAYMFLGLTGQQVFTGPGSGSLYLLGPTGGYIVGFILASFLAGSFMLKEKQSLWIIFVKLLVADFVILCSGMFWLKVSLAIPLSKAFLLGFLPFVAGDILKVALASVVYNKMRVRTKEILY